MKDGNKPNVLFVFADQWRRQSIGFVGQDPVHTPHMDHFVEEGIFFDNAISTFPLCSPNRSAILTGRYPLATGVTTNCKLGLDIAMNKDEVSIGQMLKEEGYSTGYIGKWHLDLPEQNAEPKPVSGATHWDAYTPPGIKRYGFDFWYAYNAYDQHMAPHYWKDSPEMIQIKEWSPKHETDIALDFIQKRDKDQPFALFVSWNPPHQPFDQVPERFKAMYANLSIEYPPNLIDGEARNQTIDHLRDYYAAVTGIDEQFGRLMEGLKEAGLENDTIVVLTSDHGEMMGVHNWAEHKNIWYDEAIRVPCIFRWPGKLKTGRTDVLLNSVDLVPTLLSLASLPVPERIQGQSMANVVFDHEQAEEDPASAFICHYPGAISDYEHAKSNDENINAYGWRGIRTKRYTYVAKLPYGTSRVERLLYDNELDPYQLNSELIDKPVQHQVAAVLEQELTGWLVKIGDPFHLQDR